MKMLLDSQKDVSAQFAQEYLRGHGLRAERFSKEEMREGKTPDFRVFKRTEFVAYCEAKHIQRDEWLYDQLKEASPGEIVGGLRSSDPILNRLTANIHKAAQQLAAVNSGHAYPNILVFLNSDTSCKFVGDLIGVLTGNFYGEGGTVEPIFEQFSNGRIIKEKMTIDAYVWRDSWRIHEPKVWFWANSPHYASVSAILNSDPARHRHL